MGEMIDKDQEHLRLLSIFHYVSGGVIALFACFPILHVLFGVAIVSGVFPPPQDAQGIPRLAGWFFIGFGSLFILIGWTIAGLTLYVGKCLSRRTHYTYCLIVAGIECLFIPQGTALGVFTLIVLLRPSVKQLFESRPAIL